MPVVLHGHLGELRLRRAVAPHVLHPRLAEHGRHEAAAEHTLGAHPRAAAPAEEPHLPHLLHADGQRDLVLSRGDGEPRLPEGRRARGAGVSDVDHGDAGLADLLQDALPHHRVRLEERAGGQQLDVTQREPGVVEREQQGLAAEVGHVPVPVASEPDHADTRDVDVTHHAPPSARGGSRTPPRRSPRGPAG